MRLSLSALRDVLPGIPLVESPLFYPLLDGLHLSPIERQAAIDLHERGFALIEFPDDEIEFRIERIKSSLSPKFEIDFDESGSIKNTGGVRRAQDAWTFDPDVRAIACNQVILDMLAKLYGRRAFPFQTLNFPVGTQQHLHSDSIHFSCVPERFMCGVWVAMEDVHPDAGPLTYLPGSHKWPILTNAMIGRRGFGADRDYAQLPFETAWNALVEASGTEREVFLARKGQALIWAANLLHGGSPQHDPRLTRWSQVTHYYFDDCIYYTPAYSDEALGALDLRVIVDVATDELQPNLYLGQPLETESVPKSARPLLRRIKDRLLTRGELPADFDPRAYYRLNPDVAAAQFDARTHYLNHGKAEGRRYRIR